MICEIGFLEPQRTQRTQRKEKTEILMIQLGLLYVIALTLRSRRTHNIFIQLLNNQVNISEKTKMSQNTNYSSVTPTQATKLEGDDKRNYIRNLFDDIATRYDFLRTLVFLGHTSLWYRQALRDLQLQPGDKIL